MIGVQPSRWIKLATLLLAVILLVVWSRQRPPKPLHKLTAQEWLADRRWPSIDLDPQRRFVARAPWQEMMNPDDLNLFTNAASIEDGLLVLAGREPIEGYDVGKRITQHAARYFAKSRQMLEIFKARLEAEPIKFNESLLTDLTPYVFAFYYYSPNHNLLLDRKIIIPLRRAVASPDTPDELKKRLEYHASLIKYTRKHLDTASTPP